MECHLKGTSFGITQVLPGNRSRFGSRLTLALLHKSTSDLEISSFPAMAHTSSEAVFADRCAELGLEALLPELKTRGWGTLGGFAFACAWNPERPDQDFTAKVANVLLDQDDPRLPALRRLYFEAFTEAAAEMKRRIEISDATPARRLAAPEREKRRAALLDKLPNKRMPVYLEAGETLVDTVVAMYDDRVLTYIHPENCPSRTMELEAKEPGKPWKAVKVPGLADHKPDPMALERAWKRRGFAFEMGGMVSAEKHEELVEVLMGAYTNPTFDQRYEKASFQQIIAADKWVFQFVQNECRLGFRAIAGRLPMEEAITKALASAELKWILMPLPRAASARGGPAGSSNDTQPNGEQDRKKTTKRDAKKRKAERLAEVIAENKRLKESAAPRNASTGTGTKNRVPLPKQLVGTNARDENGEPICFGYNLGSCKAVAPGERCAKGFHKCMKCMNTQHGANWCALPVKQL